MQPLRFGLFFSQQYYDWPVLRARVEAAEALGYDHAWLCDHFVSLRDGVDGPILEAWTLLAGLAASTHRIRLGTLVSGNTYRHPSLLAKEAVTVDHISGGRVILGLGAGWHEAEHRFYGFPFPPPGERVDRFHEAVQIISGLMQQERTTVEGRYYQVREAPFEPKPVQQPRVPLLIGTKGQRMLRLAARYADMWDADFAPTDPAEGDAVAKLAELERACAEAGRDPASLRRSVWSRTAAAADDEVRRFIDAYLAHGFTDIMFGVPSSMGLDRIEAVARIVAGYRTG